MVKPFFAVGQSATLDAVEGFEARAAKAPMSPLRLLGIVTGAYVACAIAFILLIGGDPIGVMVRGLSAFSVFFGVVKRMIPLWLMPSAALLAVATVWYFPALRARAKERWREAALAVLCSAAFVNIFSLVKTHLPAVVPYWADPMFTQLDNAMGIEGSFAWLSGFSTLFLLKVYMNGWIFMATFLPAVLAAFDADEARRRRFILLWAGCWVVLGNLLAVIFMSVGPIFLDRLPGGDPAAFPALFTLLERPDALELIRLKDYLWDNYASGQFSVGSGISAFPSVHVGMAVVVSIYLWERLREAAVLPVAARWRAAILGTAWGLPIAIVALYLVLSVHLGWHYLSDGVASIAVMLAIHAVLRRRLA